MKKFTTGLLCLLITATSFSQAFTLITYNTDPVSIDISSIVKDGTTIMRKVEVYNMIFNQAKKEVVLQCLVIPYSVKNGTYGNRIDSIIPIKAIEIKANNSQYVNAATGELMPVPSGNVMKEYDFFYRIAQESPVVVNDLIRSYLIRKTDW